MIVDLGTSRDLAFELLTYNGVHNAHSYGAPSNELSNLAPRPGGTVEHQFGYLRSGNVIFSNNQCALDLLEAGLSFALSSILIFSLDDVAFNNNQCDCNLFDDFLLTNALLFGITIRANDNRFREGLLNAVLSAVTVGLVNITTDNEATHFLVVEGWRKTRRQTSSCCQPFRGNAISAACLRVRMMMIVTVASFIQMLARGRIRPTGVDRLKPRS